VQELNRKVADLMQTSVQQQNSLKVFGEDKLVLKRANDDLVLELGEMTKRLTQLSEENQTQAQRIVQLADERTALAEERSSLLLSNEQLAQRLEAMGVQLSTLEGRFNALQGGDLSQPGVTNTPGAPSGILP
jgi:predicted transcriptional regulator